MVVLCSVCQRSTEDFDSFVLCGYFMGITQLRGKYVYGICSCAGSQCTFPRHCYSDSAAGARATNSGCCGTCVFFALERLYYLALVNERLYYLTVVDAHWSVSCIEARLLIEMDTEMRRLGIILNNLNGVGAALCWHWEHNDLLHRLDALQLEVGTPRSGMLSFMLKAAHGNDDLRSLVRSVIDNLPASLPVFVVNVHARLITSDMLILTLVSLGGAVLAEDVVDAESGKFEDLKVDVELRMASDTNVYRYSEFETHYGERMVAAEWFRAMPVLEVRMTPATVQLLSSGDVICNACSYETLCE